MWCLTASALATRSLSTAEARRSAGHQSGNQSACSPAPGEPVRALVRDFARPGQAQVSVSSTASAADSPDRNAAPSIRPRIVVATQTRPSTGSRRAGGSRARGLGRAQPAPGVTALTACADQPVRRQPRARQLADPEPSRSAAMCARRGAATVTVRDTARARRNDGSPITRITAIERKNCQ